VSHLVSATPRIHVFRYPYERFERYIRAEFSGIENIAGSALIWWLEDSAAQEGEFEDLRTRPAGLPLIILLPPAREIRRTLPLLNYVGALNPRAVLPGAALGTTENLRHALSAPPRSLADAATSYLMHRGIVNTRTVRREVHRIFEFAPETGSVSKLSRKLYLSRRTLGRHLTAAGLPVPSHWLQFARLLHVTINLQNETTAVFRIAARCGYPDGFTMSNQMKRLTGFRPTEVRQRLGWEWVVEAWLLREGLGGGEARA
jgi:AraC-like DNA-binding protein